MKSPKNILILVCFISFPLLLVASNSEDRVEKDHVELRDSFNEDIIYPPIIISPSIEKANAEASYSPDVFQSVPLFNAHSHNDYKNLNPLLSALNHGFMSIEVDVHLIDGELYVSHLRPILPNKNNTLSKLYLIPLFEMFMQGKGKIVPYTDQPITLMIDIKSEGSETYNLLKEIIKPYQKMISHWKGNNMFPSAVNLMISGNRPIEEILLAPIRYVQIDGRLEDLGKNYPTELMPVISIDFSKICTRHFFSKKASKKKMENLHLIADVVHAENKRFRLWKIPEDELVWSIMLKQGVDIINADNIPMLAFFLRKYNLSDLASN